jgi:hypothetical protein
MFFKYKRWVSIVRDSSLGITEFHFLNKDGEVIDMAHREKSVPESNLEGKTIIADADDEEEETPAPRREGNRHGRGNQRRDGHRDQHRDRDQRRDKEPKAPEAEGEAGPADEAERPAGEQRQKGQGGGNNQRRQGGGNNRGRGGDNRQRGDRRQGDNRNQRNRQPGDSKQQGEDNAAASNDNAVPLPPQTPPAETHAPARYEHNHEEPPADTGSEQPGERL